MHIHILALTKTLLVAFTERIEHDHGYKTTPSIQAGEAEALSEAPVMMSAL